MNYGRKIFDVSAISLIVCECVQTIIKIFVDLFLVSKIYACDISVSLKITYIALFYIIQFTLTGLPFLFNGYILRIINKSLFVSIGAVFLTSSVLLVYLFGVAGDNILLSYTPIIAVVYGVGYNFFSSGYGALQGETISSKHQVKFAAVKKIGGQVVSVLFPVTFGLIVDNLSFSYLSLIMIALCIVLVVFSFFIKPKVKYNLEFDFKKFGKYVKERKSEVEPLKFVYLSDFFRGASYDSLVVLSTIFVIRAFDSNTSLGLLSSIFTLCSIVVLFVYLKFYRKHRAVHFILPACVLVAFSTISVCFSFNRIVVAIFYAAFAILNVILLSISDARRRGSLARLLSMHNHILEVNALCEISLLIGRVLSMLIILFYGIFNMEWILYFAIVFVSLMYVCFGISLILLEKSLIRQDEKYKEAHSNENYEKSEE